MFNNLIKRFQKSLKSHKYISRSFLLIFLFVSIFFSLYSISSRSWIWESGELYQKILGTTSGFASFTGVIAILEINKNKRSGYVWGISNAILFGLFSLSINLTGDFLINIIFYIPIFIIMLFKTRNNNKIQERRLTLSSVLMLISFFAFAFLFFYFLTPLINLFWADLANIPSIEYGENFNCYWSGRVIDTLINSISMIAFITMVLNYQKTWYIWITKNILGIIFFSGVGVINISIIIMNILFLLISIYNLKTRKTNMKIAIIGPGAVGKTTIIKELEKSLTNFKFLYERDEVLNKDFDNYMNDMKTYAFEFQKRMFSLRKKEIQKFPKFENVIIDRHLIDDFIFPEAHIIFNNFTEKQIIEWKKIEKKYLLFLKSIPKIDILFLIVCDDETIEKRRVERSEKEKRRKYETKNHKFFESVNSKYKSDEFKRFASLFANEIHIFNNDASSTTASKIKDMISEKL